MTPTPQWKLHQLVLHEYDEKEPRSLRKVVGLQRDGRIKTQYIDPRRTRTVQIDLPQALRDPSVIGLDLHGITSQNLQEFQLAHDWNRQHPVPGDRITRRSDDGTMIPVNQAVSRAYMVNQRAYIDLEHGGPLLLRFINAAPGPEGDR